MGRLSKDKDIFGYDKYSSNTYSDDQSDLPRNSIDRDARHEHIGRRGTQKHIRKDCHHHIECIAATFLAILM